MEDARLPSNCTLVNLTATSCEAASADEFTVTPSSILTTASLVGGASNGRMHMGTNGFLTETMIGLVGVLLTWL